MPRKLRIAGARALVEGALVEADIAVEDGVIAALGGPGGHGPVLDGRGLLALPGLVDLHGDAFERQIMPRPGVAFDPALALLDTDRQLVANGITTAFHGLTWSWELGLRDGGNARRILEAVEALRPRLAADTRVHLRHEIFNIGAEAEIEAWMAGGRIGCLAFNDHLTGTIKVRHRPEKMARMVERSGLSEAGFLAHVEAVWARRDEVKPSIERLAAAARANGVPLLSHDDLSPAERAWHRALGCAIAEFPIDVPTAEAARAGGDVIVFGAPNVVRGGSHTGCPSATEMAARGLCDVLASDYYYPALPLAPFKLAAAGAAPLPAAWALVSEAPARALGLTDRGRIAPGLAADIALVDDREAAQPRVVATLARGHLVHLADGARLGAH